MARVILTISIFIYLIFSNGWVLDVHYCMNKISSVHLFDTKPEQCSQCGMGANESEGCCHDEQQVVKLVQDQRTPEALTYAISAPVTLEAAITFSAYKTSWKSEQRTVRFAHDPPKYPLQELYLLNRVFRL